MKRTPDNDKPVLHRVERIPLPEGRVALRVVLLIALLIIAIVSFAFGVNGLVGSEPGLAEIEALTGSMNCSEDFTFYYNLGYGELNATDERRAVRSAYSQACTDALEIFSPGTDFDGRHNLWYLNSHLNETVEIEPALYDALMTLDAHGARYHFLAPLAELNRALASSMDDAEAAVYDPRMDSAAAAFASECASYAADEGHISIEFHGDSRVTLRVSDEYAAFCKANAVGAYVDLAWLTNAFSADYICSVLAAEGYTRGCLISRDGFMRCMDAETGAEYSFTFTHLEGNTVSPVSTLSFAGETSVVFLRGYPPAESAGGYYVYADGTIRSPYIDPAGGLDRTAIPEIAGYSFTKGCADTAILLAGAFIGEGFSASSLEALANSGVTVYYMEKGALTSA